MIGMHAGSTGTVIVQGADAQWIDTGTDSIIYVGDQGVGAVELSGGASWQSQNVLLGAGAGGEGSVTLSGTDTLWQNTSYIQIGYNGAGAVTVSDGARVETAHTNIGLVEGSLILEGEGTYWFSQYGGQISTGVASVSGSLTVRDGATFETSEQGLYIGGGSTVTVTGEGSQLLIGTLHSELPASWGDADGWFSIGGAEGATVLISDGAVVHTDGTHVSNDVGDFSYITVTGEGTQLINDLSFYIGGGGNGYGGYAEMTISDGASVTAYTGAAGTDEGAEGVILITGEGSTLEIFGRDGFVGNMRVGYAGTGTVIVQEGGLLKNANILDIASLDTSTGVLVIGAEEGEAAVGAGTVEAANGVFFGEGDATLLFNHTDTDYVFGSDISSSEFGDGGKIRHLAGHSALTGDGSGYTGTVDVEGGTLVFDGNAFNASSLWVGGDAADDAQVVVQNGATLTTGAHATIGTIIGNEAGQVGTMTISGAGTSWVEGGTIYIGLNGTGSVTASGGAHVEAEITNIGFNEGSLVVEGTDTHWLSTYGGQIGLSPDATGSLTVRDGATFEVFDGDFYVNTGGTLTVTGEGTQFLVGTEHGELPATWGDSDGWFAPTDGTVLISGGALLHADGSHIASNANTLADITVTGEGSRMINDLSLYVGGNGNARLTIADGASVTAYTGAAATEAGGEGNILITGEGSTLEILGRDGFVGNMRVGYAGQSTVIVQEGGLLKNANILDIASLDTSTGVLVIGAEEGEAAVGAGTVEAANGIFFGLGDATLVFNHSGDDYTFDNVMFGEGGEIRHLAGTTNFTADSSGYEGTLDVMGGTVKANGDLSGADVTVADGATIGGAGTIGSLVLGSGATLAPGNSPGTLTVMGDVLFASGSIFDVEIDGALHDSILVENGDVTIEDGAFLNAAFAPGVLLDNPYEVIALGMGSTGDIIVQGDGFVLPSEDLPLLEGVIGYGTGGVTVTYQGIATPWSALVSTANQGAAANGVQSLGGSNPLFYAAMFLEESELDDVFDMLSGEIHASAKTALINESQLLRSLAMDRTALTEEGTGLWATAFGNWGSTDGNGNAAQLDRDTSSIFMGVDAEAGGWRFGVLMGYGDSDFDVDARASSGESETYHLGAYAGGRIDRVRLRAGLSHSWHNVSTSRSVSFPAAQTLAAEYDAGTTQIFGELGYGIGTAGFEVEPFAGAAYVSLDTDGYAETGGEAALAGDDTTTDVTFTTLGLRGSAGIGGASLTGLFGWRHAFGDVTPEARHGFGAAATPFTVTGVPIAEDALLTEFGLNLPLAENIHVTVSYKGQYGDGATDHSALGGLSLRF